MTVVEQAEKILGKMTRAEKAMILRWVVQDLGDKFPGIDKNPNVCGGSACIVRTRIPVWTLVSMKESGFSDAQILESFPALVEDDLVSAWAYNENHVEEIQKDLLENRDA